MVNGKRVKIKPPNIIYGLVIDINEISRTKDTNNRLK